MATWLTHLRIAEKIKEKIVDIRLSYLMLGSIAPDSGVPDETYRNYNPSKEVTHFATKEKEMEGKSIIDLEGFYEKHLAPSKILTRSDNTRSFLWGYYFHLITDDKWIEFIAPYKQTYEEEKQEEDFVSAMRDEMYSLDFLHLDHNSYDIIEKFKNIDANVNFFNEFESSYIYECQKRIIDYYEKERYVLEREYRFFSSEKIDGFINEVAHYCIDILL
ncbi:MAG: hypothetical protein WBL93_01035 [Lutisporaceae bacterium]